MCGWLSKLTLNRKLGLTALVLGAVAVFANVHPGRTVTVHAKDLLTAVERQEDHLTPLELAGWIIEGRSDYRLLDLRNEKAYAEYHIPTAESVPLGTLTEGEFLRPEKIVLYSEGGIHAAQAWMLLRGMGYRAAYTLLGGLEAWKDEVLFPLRPQDPTPEERARFERAVEVAKFFGGQPRAAAAGPAEPFELPKLAAPAPAVAAPALPAGARRAPRKKKEGC